MHGFKVDFINGEYVVLRSTVTKRRPDDSKFVEIDTVFRGTLADCEREKERLEAEDPAKAEIGAVGGASAPNRGPSRGRGGD